MHFASVRIVTDDVKRLVAFYHAVTRLAPTVYSEDFAEFVAPACRLAIGSARAVARFQAGAARGGANASVIIEFRADDVDADYERLKGVVADVVQAPTTMPWGNRSLLLRDPEGNLVNVFTPVTAEAVGRFGEQASGASP